jgi:hypothetical protein
MEGEVRPVRPGVEIGTPDGEKGTLGLLVTTDSFSATAVFGLSCSHVLAEGGLAPPKSLVVQPMNRFVSPAQIAIGELTNVVTRLRPRGMGTNSQDFALFRLTVAALPQDMSTGRKALSVSPLRADEILKGTDTWMAGAVTREGAFGKVTTQSAEPLVVKELPGVSSATFVGAVRYETRNARGDSGAAVMEAGTDVVLGLHFAGIPERNIGFFLPLADFFDVNRLRLL